MAFHRGSRSKDYGGNSYGGAPYRSKPGSTLSFVCRDCQTLRYVSRRELRRASRPRCLRCGGPLLETDATAEKTMSDATASNAKALNESAPYPKGHCRCWGCDVAYRKNFYLGKHIEETASCREQYSIKGKVTELAGARYYSGTFTILRDGKKFKVIGLSADINAWCGVATFKTIYNAEKFIKPYSISLQATRIKQHWQEQPKREVFDGEIRCAVCRSRFVRVRGTPAEWYLENHLVINDYCYANYDECKTKKNAAKRRAC